MKKAPAQKNELIKTDITSVIPKKNGGKRPGSGHKKGQIMPKTLDKMRVKEELEQRFMRLTHGLSIAQATLALGQTFLYKIEKTWVPNKGKGYWQNEKPRLVTSQDEIEDYLNELAENNGSLSDDREGGTTYYYITTKEPNNEALKNIFDRVHGRPKESLDVNATVGLNLVELAKEAEEVKKKRDANKK